MDYPVDKKLYSFDLFDTLVGRIVQNPSIVFKLLEQHHTPIQYRNIIYKNIGFKRLRILAEKLARKRSPREDVTLIEIYQVLNMFITNTDDLQKAEVDYENLVLYPIDANVVILKKLLAQGKTCCIVSDMYLPLSAIQVIVADKLGLIDIPIFLSSEIFKTKHHGSLYQEVATRYKLDYQDIVHFGDNAHADIKVADSLGINTIQIPNYNKEVTQDNIFSYLKPIDASKLENIYYELGFYLAGPCAWVTSKWIADDLEKHKLKKIFFGARDGFLFNKFFQEISPIPATYFKVSRRALFLPTFAIDNSHNYLLFEGGESLSAYEFFSRLDLICPENLRLLLPYNNEQLFLSELRNQHFFEKCQIELNDLLLYLKQINFKDNVAFFDLGWRGSLQSSLQNITKEFATVYGYYFGLTEKNQGNPFYKAYYFYKNRNFNRRVIVFQSLAFFEFIFTEPVHTLKKIKANAQGDIEFEYLENQDTHSTLEARKTIMQGAEDFKNVIIALDKKLSMQPKVYEKAIHQQIIIYLDNPPNRVIDVFKKIDHSAAFGGTYTRKIIEDKPFSLENYRQAFWRSGYVNSRSGKQKLYAKLIHAGFYKLGGLYLKQKILALKNNEEK